MKTTEPKPERLISMIGPLILASIAGAKTETRRVCNPQPAQEHPNGPLRWKEFAWFDGASMPDVVSACPYGTSGDILAVREAAWMWCERVPNGRTPAGRPKYRYVPVRGVPPVYCADRPDKPVPGEGWTEHAKRNGHSLCWRYKQPRYLPRWAIRLRVQIVGIRVERVQDIAEAGARAEGAIQWWLSLPHDQRPHLSDSSAKTCFRALWDAINAARRHGWDKNEWVWVIQYKKEAA